MSINVKLFLKNWAFQQWHKVEGLSIFTFPGGEVHVSFPDDHDLNVHEDARHYDFAIVAKITSSDDLIAALVLNDYLRRKGAFSVSLICPYLPAARQDRGAPLSAKVYADLINSAGFDRVVGLDPHSDVMPALINKYRSADVVTLWEDVFKLYKSEDTVLVIPDQGAGKRVEAVAARYGFRTVQGFKHRDFATGKLSGFSVEPFPEGTKNAVIVDDICDGGGTFIGLALVINEQTACRLENLALLVTHGIFSKGTKDLRRYFNKIITSDSLPSADIPANVEVISAEQILLAAL